jgi:alkylhydroperoxidase/carboxymuconolactone decarboxylase family protein YurZ
MVDDTKCGGDKTMPTDLVSVPSGDLMKVNHDVGAGFRAMRKALVAAGPLSHDTCELILISSFAAHGFERSFKIHALRALQMGMTKDALAHATMITLGATTALLTTTNALTWLDEVYDEFCRQPDKMPGKSSPVQEV